MEYFILLSPLLGACIAGFFGNKIGDKFSELITSLFVTIAAVCSLIIFYNYFLVGKV